MLGERVVLHRNVVPCTPETFAELWALAESPHLSRQCAAIHRIAQDVRDRAGAGSIRLHFSTNGAASPLVPPTASTLFCYTFNAPGSPPLITEARSTGSTALWSAVVHSGDLLVCVGPRFGASRITVTTPRAYCRGQRVFVHVTTP